MGRVDETGNKQFLAAGINSDIDVLTVPEDVWGEGGAYPFQSAVVSLEILSDNAADASAGVGARTISVAGLDANYLTQKETVTMNGVTPVVLANQYLRILRIEVVTSGTDESNTGKITLRVPGPGDILAVITAQEGRSLMAIYTIPADFKMGYIVAVSAGVQEAAGSGSAKVLFQLREAGKSWITGLVRNVNESGPEGLIVPPAWPPLQPKTDIRVRVISVVTNNTAVTADFQIVNQI